MELIRLTTILENRLKAKVSWKLTSNAVLVKSQTRIKDKKWNSKWKAKLLTKVRLGNWVTIIWTTWVIID